MAKSVTIELDKPRRLRFDLNALADLEGVLGLGIGQIFKEEMIGVRVIRALLWAGLKWEDRGLTLERVGTLLNSYLESEGTLQGLLDKIMEALTAAGWLAGLGGTEADQGNGAGAEVGA